MSADLIRESCREEMPRGKKCGAPAEFKLLPSEALGPRCYDHATMHVGPRALGDRQWAIFDLRKAADALERAEKERDDPDYSPAYQDEYQRLWHDAAAERDRLRAENEAVRDEAEKLVKWLDEWLDGMSAGARPDVPYWPLADALARKGP